MCDTTCPRILIRYPEAEKSKKVLRGYVAKGAGVAQRNKHNESIVQTQAEDDEKMPARWCECDAMLSSAPIVRTQACALSRYHVGDVSARTT